MKTYIIYASFHKKNTEKIAKRIASTLKVDIDSFENVNLEKLEKADLLGFGSGVYFGKFHRGLINLVKKLERQENKQAFIFSTAGMKKNFLLNHSHSHFKKLLNKKGFKCIDEFSCLGYDTYGILKIFGGVNKKRPNEKDLSKAEDFALNLKK